MWNKGFDPTPETHNTLEEAAENFTHSLTSKAEEMLGKTSGLVKAKFNPAPVKHIALVATAATGVP